MRHNDYVVDVFNPSGLVIDQKPRQAINKAEDIFHTVYVLIQTPKGRLVLGDIPAASRNLPNFYVGQLGAPMATIRRHGEAARTAAERGIRSELNIEQAQLHLVGENTLRLDDGRINIASVFYMTSQKPAQGHVTHFIIVSPDELRKMVNQQPQRIAPTLRAIWKLFNTRPPLA